MLHILGFQVARVFPPEPPDRNTRMGGAPIPSLFQVRRAASRALEKRLPWAAQGRPRAYQTTRSALLTFQPLPGGLGQKLVLPSRE